MKEGAVREVDEKDKRNVVGRTRSAERRTLGFLAPGSPEGNVTLWHLCVRRDVDHGVLCLTSCFPPIYYLTHPAGSSPEPAECRHRGLGVCPGLTTHAGYTLFSVHETDRYKEDIDKAMV